MTDDAQVPAQTPTNISAAPLVPGRTCGECKACCITLRVETPEFSKPANIPCAHCADTGCAIYETRFPICHSFYCGWRQAAYLGDEWRPDRSGVILFSPPVEGYASPFGLDLVLTDGEASIRRPYFAPFVMQMVRERRAVFMTINDRKALLNPYLETVVPLGVGAVLQQLLRFHAGATTHQHSRTLPA